VGGTEAGGEGSGEDAKQEWECSMIVEYHMGPHHDKEEIPYGLTESQVQEYFETWLWNRSDIGWTLIEGELKEEKKGE
jgi:hypothetical protein